jgi:hypothetical protein
MNSNIVEAIHSIDIEKYHSIEKEREAILGNEQFQNWCKEMHIGSRVEIKDYKADEIMQQYLNYPKWVSRLY